ncbi:hypothetical protein GGS20DRAFT_578583 [Poronia punctata]|nr:hypothetical protein GGS20DRAFT_578583 [Poronia punctata]
MIGTSLPEYILIRIAIFLVEYMTPICLASALVLVAVAGPERALSQTTTQVVLGILVGYSVLDTLYALFIFYPYIRRLQLEAVHPPLKPKDERLKLFKKCLANIPDPVNYLRVWFLGADEPDVRRDNVREFISWAFFDRHVGNETAAEKEELDEYVDMIEQRLGHPLEPGMGKAKSFRLTLDEIKVRYRSVIWYLIVGMVDVLTYFRLSYHGLQFHTQAKAHSQSVVPPRPQSSFTKKRSVSRLSYWYRPHRAQNKLPVLFLHGIGIGLWPYVPYLTGLNKGVPEDEQIGIIALEVLPVASRLTDAPLSKSSFLFEIALILEEHGWDRFAVVGHSYGTVLAAHMLQSPDLNPRIESLLLVDPVCILLHLPDVAYNFTRRKPTRANEWMLWYFASMEPGVAHCLARHFFWRENIIWKEDLLEMGQGRPVSDDTNDSVQLSQHRSRKVAVCLAERDLIVDTATLRKYLVNEKDWMSVGNAPQQSDHMNETQQHASQDNPDSSNLEVVWFDGLDHAQIFDRTKSTGLLIDMTRQYCE